MKHLWLALVLAGLPALARAEDMAAMISQYRQAHGLPAVRSDAELTAVAQRQAQAMAARKLLDHDAAGPFASRIAGAHASSAAENIAMGTKSWAETLKIWQASSGHNVNLLLPGATRVGVAVASAGKTSYWAMVIGNEEPRPKPVPKQQPQPNAKAKPGLLQSLFPAIFN
jgi:uncharacterized protein YkwD